MSEELKSSELNQVAGGKGEYAGPCFYYTVKKGDTLGKLAKRFGTTIDTLMYLNPIIKDKNLIRIGWKLLIPAK